MLKSMSPITFMNLNIHGVCVRALCVSTYLHTYTYIKEMKLYGDVIS